MILAVTGTKVEIGYFNAIYEKDIIGTYLHEIILNKVISGQNVFLFLFSTVTNFAAALE